MASPVSPNERPTTDPSDEPTGQDGPVVPARPARERGDNVLDEQRLQAAHDKPILTAGSPKVLQAG